MSENEAQYTEAYRAMYGRLDALYEEVCGWLSERDLQPTTLLMEGTGGEGEPLFLPPERLLLPDEPSGKLMGEVAEELARVGGGEALESFADRLDSREVRPGELIRRVLGGQRISTIEHEVGMEEDVLGPIAVLTARPFMKWLAGRLEGLDAACKEWMKGICPVCGAAPEMGRLTAEDGRRMLWCWLCATEWRFHRLVCPYCSHEAAEGQCYFTVEGTNFRVDLCDACGCYLKVVDDRETTGTEMSWLLNDVLTRHLDALAQKEGYHPVEG